jgi:hypothetical protein
MYLLTGIQSNKKILLTYDVHRPNQIHFLKHHIAFKSFFINYPFYAEYIGDLNTEYEIFKWAKTNDENQELDSLTAACFSQHDGVIGFEMTKNMVHYLKKNNIPFINYHNCVYRCAQILHYSIESNKNLPNVYLPKKPKVIPANIKIGTLLIGQMQFDRAMIKDGKFISLMNYEDIIEQLPKPIYFSPHPRGNEELLIWAKIKNYKIANFSSYNLLESRPELVCGVSSSMLYEARDLWNLPVLFLNENESIKNFTHLPVDIAFDHHLIDAIMEQDETKIKIFLGKNYTKFLSSQNN